MSELNTAIKAKQVKDQIVSIDGNECRRVWLSESIEIMVNYSHECNFNDSDCTFIRLSDYIIFHIDGNVNCEVLHNV